MPRNEQAVRRTVDDHINKIVEAVELAEETNNNNPVNVLRRRFTLLRNPRQPYLDEARFMAELVIPGMYEGNTTDPVYSSNFIFGQEKFDTANQSLISKGTLLLSWTMANVILPSDGDYFSRNIEESIASQLQQLESLRQQQSAAMGAGGDPQDFLPISLQINQELLRDDLIVKKHTASSNHQEVLARCLFHSLISGISVFGHLTMGEAKTYTIQNSIVVFDSAHEPVEVIVVDRMPLVSLPENVRKKVAGNAKNVELLSPREQFVTIYTQQVRVSPDTLRINTEIDGIPIDEMSFDVSVDAPVLIPLPFMFVNEADPYPIGWLTYNRGDCNAYENLSLSMEGMVSAAAAVILGLPPGSRITTDEIRSSPGLSVVPTSNDKAQLNMVAAPIAQNLQQVLGWHDKKERQLMMTFGMDFAVQRAGERVTAEEIQTMREGLNELFGATYKQLERTYQQKHARRQFSLAEDAKLIRPIDKKSYTLLLTAGLQDMEAQKEVGKMDQVLARGAQMAQLTGQPMTSLATDATLRWYAQKLRLDVSDKLLTPQQQAEQVGMGQLLTTIRQMGPQAPAIVAQMLQHIGSGQAPMPQLSGGTPDAQQSTQPSDSNAAAGS